MASNQNKNALSPREATEQIRTLANDDFVTVHRTEHFKDRLSERDLLISDATHALKNGFVRDNPEQSTQPKNSLGLFQKYKAGIENYHG